TDPTATPDAFTPCASPRVSPGGRGSCMTLPFCQITGSRFEPKRVVDAVPTTIPLSFSLFDTEWFRPARLGTPTSPLPSVQVNAWLTLFPMDRPTAIPPGDTPKPCE